MNWLRWTSNKLRTLRTLMRGVDQQAEMMRLVDGIERVKHVDDCPEPLKIYPAPNDKPCACCNGRRCLVWRQSGHTVGCGGHTEDDKCWVSDENGVRIDGCGGHAEPIPVGASFRDVMEATIMRPGRHTVRYVTEHFVPWNWSPFPLYMRVRMWPRQWEAKLGRPVQIGMMRQVALP